MKLWPWPWPQSTTMPKKALYHLPWQKILWLKPIKVVGAKAILLETHKYATSFLLIAQFVGLNNSFLNVFGCATQPEVAKVTLVLLIMAIVSWTWNCATPASLNGRNVLVLQDLTLSLTKITHNLVKFYLANLDSLNQTLIVLVVNLAMLLAMDVVMALTTAVLTVISMLDIAIISVNAFSLQNLNALKDCLCNWTKMDVSTVFHPVLSLSSQTQSLEYAKNVLKDVNIAVVLINAFNHAN